MKKINSTFCAVLVLLICVLYLPRIACASPAKGRQGGQEKLKAIRTQAVLALKKERDARQKVEADYAKLRGAYKSMEARVNGLNKELYAKKQECEKLRKNLNSLNKENYALRTENEKLRPLIPTVDGLKKDIAALYQELATAYTQLKLYDMAMETYKKAIAYNPKNSAAYYNLGLLYQYAKRDPNKSIECFKQYLKLEPRARDKDEVRKLIQLLEEGNKEEYVSSE